MDSKLRIIKTLINEGEKYSFDNFCLKGDSYGRGVGGPDTPEWSAFKKRVVNIVNEMLSGHSPAISLAKKGADKRTRGYRPDSFEFAKVNLLEALRILESTVKDDFYNELKQIKSESSSSAYSNKVFVVHGHDEKLKIDVERFLYEIGLTPVVLHREADEGATIIEKFEKHSDVGYAFILLSPDEICYTVDQIGIPEENRQSENRARPNVIFEFGYFVGKLGRKRVCCLHKGDVIVPSDLNGLIYKKVEETIGSQAYSIFNELKSAGYNI